MPYVPSIETTPSTPLRTNNAVGWSGIGRDRATIPSAYASVTKTSLLGYTKKKFKGSTYSGRVDDQLWPTYYFLHSYNYDVRGAKGLFRNLTGSYYAYDVLPVAGIQTSNGVGIGNPLDCYNPWTTHSHNVLTRALVANAATMVETKAIIRARQSAIDMSENLAGLRATAGMLADIVINIGRVLSALRSKETSKAVKLMEDLLAGSRKSRPSMRKRGPTIVVKRSARRRIADGYLRYIYGIAPLMGDIHTLMERSIDYVEKLSGEEPLRFSSRDVTYIPRITSDGMKHVLKSNYEATVTSLCTLTYDMNPHQTYALRQFMQRYSADSLLYYVWVATPWSFVMDWFIPVASFLQALSGVYGFTYRHGFTSQTIHAKMHETGLPLPKVGSYRIEGGEMEFSAEGLFFRRQLVQYPSTGLYLSNPFNFNRLAAAVALAISNQRQVTKGKRRAKRRTR